VRGDTPQVAVGHRTVRVGDLRTDRPAAGGRLRIGRITAVRDALLLVPGVLAAAAGGELFVRATVGAAARSHVAPGVVAATVAAFATSSPELSVGINSAAAGRPEVSLGDVLGSNVVNLGLILGLAILLGGLRPRARDLRRDVPLAVGTPLLLLALGLDGVIGRADSVLLLVAFGGWLAFTVVQAARERSAIAEVAADRTVARIVVDGTIGLGLLLLAGRLIVLAATDVGLLLGWDTFTVGAVLVAVATSVPELATVLAARLRGHDEVSAGTVLGSNIFNGLLIVGVVAAIAPIAIRWSEFLVTVAAGVLTALLVIPGRSHRLPPSRGAALVAVYAGYVATLLAIHQPGTGAG
jgi:cation:H+ antiporter